MTLKKQIEDWMSAHKDEFLADLAKLVSIRSVKEDALPGMPFGEGAAKALAAALEISEGYGFAVKNYDNYVGTADLNDQETALDMLVHLDVVTEGEGWDTDPYTMTQKEDGLIYGRGTDDDKGPAVAALYAMRCVRDLGIPAAKNVRLIFGTDEESGSSDLEHYFSIEKSAPYTFSPDAEFPVYNTEKGMYHPVFEMSWARETAEPRVESLDGGVRINVLPGNASALIVGLAAEEIAAVIDPLADSLNVQRELTEEEGGVRLAVTGTASHAASPDEGNNAITALLAMLAALPLAETASAATIRSLCRLFPHGDCHGTALGIDREDEISGRLTLAFSLLTFTPDGMHGQFDARVPIASNEENCRMPAQRALEAAGFTVAGEMSAPHHTPAGTPFVNTLLACYEEFTGEKGECRSMGGGTYVHDIEGGVAFGAGFPGFVSNLHGPNERASADNLLAAAAIFAGVIARMTEAGPA